MRCAGATSVKIVGANHQPRSGRSQAMRAAHRALLLAGGHQRLDALELLGGVDRADVGVLVERVADAQQAHAVPQLRGDLVGHRLLDEQPRSGAADVALVEEDPLHDALDRLVDGGVLEDDVGRLAAELEREPDAAAGERGLDVLADRGRAREGDLVDLGAHERGAGDAVAGDDVRHAGRQLGLLEDLGQQQRGQRRRLGRLEDRRVAARQRRARASRPPSAAGSSTARSGRRRRRAWPCARRRRTAACRPSPA